MKNLVIPKQRIAENATMAPQDRARINQCRGDHNRLGFAYQMAFVRLTGRFPLQVPLEILEEIVGFVAYDLDIAPEAITHYAQRQATVSAHQQQIREYLHLKLFEEAESELLNQFLSEETCRLEQTAALLSKTKEFLQTQRIVLPADSTLRRIIGEQRDQARQYMFARLMEMLSVECQQQLDELLTVSSSQSSRFQVLKEPPGFASAGALLNLVEKLECIQNTGILSLDISWLNNNLQKSLARRARQSSAWRVRVLQPAHRYTVLTCFLWQTYHDTIDHLVEMYHKLITKVWRRAENELGEQVKKRRKWVRNTLRILKTIKYLDKIIVRIYQQPFALSVSKGSCYGSTSSPRTEKYCINFVQVLSIVLLDENLPDQDIRSTIFRDVPQETLKAQLAEAEEWFSGKHSDPFAFVMIRFSYLRQFAPSVLEHLSFHSASEGKTSLLKAIEVLQDLNNSNKRSIPDNAPIDFIPQRLQSFVKQDGHIDRRAYECAVLTNLRDELKRGNLWVQDSKKYRRLDDYFISKTEWTQIREEFFRKAGLPSKAEDLRAYFSNRLNLAFDRFLRSLPDNAYVTIEEDGWSCSVDQAETLDEESTQKLSALKQWISGHLPSIRLPDLLIAVDNELHFTRHFLSSSKHGTRHPEEICKVIATLIAYGCNIGPYTMAKLTNNITYDEMKRIADWHLHETALRQALVDIVNAITVLETTQAWGAGKTSSSDGQRFLFPRKVLDRTWSPRINDFAIEFYSFIADNYAPFYSVPIECSARDAAYVLDGLLYHETDLDIEEHYVDTHGYTEINFAAFAMVGKRFCPRIRGLSRQWIYRIDTQKDYGPLAPIVDRRQRTIQLDMVCRHWDRMGQFYASLQQGHITASTALKRLVSCGPNNEFYQANRELGRIFKTEFILHYLSDPGLRRRIQRGLLKGEQLHALARNVHYGRLGKHQARDFQQQMSTASCLILLLACIVYWQAKNIGRILFEHDPEEHGLDISLLSHISPIEWENILLYGQYELNRNLVR